MEWYKRLCVLYSFYLLHAVTDTALPLVDTVAANPMEKTVIFHIA